MKKWIALLLTLCLLLPCTALGEAAATEEAAGETQASDLHNARYFFEHNMLPNEFFQNTEQLVSFLKKNGIYTLWQNFANSNGFDPFFSEEEFGFQELPQEDGADILLLTLPMPDRSPLCCRIYLCLNPQGEAAGYYTIEYDNYFGDKWFMCSWEKDGKHMDYGVINTVQEPSDPGYEAALANELDMILKMLHPDS